MDGEWPPFTFLSRLRSETRDEFLQQGIKKNYSPHQPLLQQGDSSRHVLLITSGVVKVAASSASGYDVLLAVRLAGDLVGEMAAFEELPRSGTVVACSEVTVRIIQLPVLEGLLSRHPDAMRAMLRMLSARLRWANRRRIDYKAYDAPTRFARVLAELGQAYAQPAPGDDGKRCVLGFTLTQKELASLAGLALPTAEKCLATLTAQGLVQRSYRNITICDVPKLLEFAKLDGEIPY
ncbi:MULTISPECIES: Crp/Fnr family transcriptional regulator [unclassified Streptomyces]|jgi:CRP-like cAMP-binding protein|uniref:Crp/Fnr family transcriptional regulator n=1 Tax=Streptomyces sp. NBC_01393 TaxID=2903851 RepID=A0AAU3I0J4_9ACTN|nr:Crp/Fnr family transcriptional regulator [Streptomyces sp. NBC_00151]WRZ40487.1 Crp/Fnr family transcriptional regulator [Streptomyces sp. NBC_00151]